MSASELVSAGVMRLIARATDLGTLTRSAVPAFERYISALIAEYEVAQRAAAMAALSRRRVREIRAVYARVRFAESVVSN
jgi:hypothetical protein